MGIKIINGRIVYEPNPGPIARASARTADNIRNFVGGLFGGQGTNSNVDAFTGAGVGPVRNTGNPPRMLEEYFKDQAEEQQIASGTYGNVLGNIATNVDTNNTVTNNVVTNNVVTNNVVTNNVVTGGTLGVGNYTGGTGGGRVSTPTFTPPTSSLNWTRNLANITSQGQQLANTTRTAQQENINTQYAEQLKAIQTAARQQQMSEQQSRQQIAEQAFTRERQLLEAAQQRGLGGSGIEQLAGVQQRTATGQQINQLAQQSGVQREQLANALSQASAQKGAALNQAEINFLTTNLQLSQAQFQQGLSLEDRERANAYQDFQARLASAEFASGQEYLQWQKDNSKEQARLLGVKNKQDVLAVLADPNLSEDWKKAWVDLNTDAGFITDAEGKDWISKNLKTIAPTESGTPTDYTSILGTKAINLILKDRGQANETTIWSVKKPDGTTSLLEGSAILDKNNPESPVYAFKDLPGYQQITPKFSQYITGPGAPVKVFFTYNGKDYDTFAKASEQFRIAEMRKG
jgi:DNA-binding phage protein